MEMSHPGDGSGAVPALEALQTHLSLPADDEREQPRCARFTASLQHPAHILYLKLKKITLSKRLCVFRLGERVRVLFPPPVRLVKGNLGSLKWALWPLSEHIRFQGGPLLKRFLS